MSVSIPRAARDSRDCGVRDRQTKAPSSADSTFVVTVVIDEGSARDPLLVGASTLHRRGVDVIEAELSRPAYGRRVFSVMFRATDRQAETVLHTFAGQVDVFDAKLFRAIDRREPAVGAPGLPADLTSAWTGVA